MENTSKNFVLQLGALVALYASLSALVAVVFGIINIAYPDAAAGYWAYESAQSGIRFGLATLIVFFPVYVVLTRMVNQIRRKEHGVYLTLTRWLIYLSLFVGSAILLSDLVAVLWAFLNGEVTMRFLLKAGALLVIVSAALKYYILDTRGYWTTHERQALMYAGAATILVLTAVVVGFTSIDSPAEVREQRIDQQQISDLQDMQWRIEEHYRTNAVLPDSVAELYTSVPAPKAPEGRSTYEYTVLGEQSYELCATFARQSMRDEYASVARPMYDTKYHPMNYNWEHGVGHTCFERVAPEVEAGN
ncbi:MAG: DUF5671 domain-containing protein [Candidatus Paceibacterota bacterium]